jgi:hypothetical protein
MTTTVLVHNGHRLVRVITEDRVWDAEKNALSDEWVRAGAVTVGRGQLYQTYCTDTRRITIVEPAEGTNAHGIGPDVGS